MADRTVSVRLRAVVDDYRRGMRSAADETDSFTRKVTGGLGASSKSMGELGSTLTRKVTLPLGIAAVGAVKLAGDFETSFAQMVGLAGVTGDEVDGLRESVLGLAGETGRAPQELAEALYFASSAGLDTAQAMDAVTLAARASAAGMGSAVDIVGLVASATASYGAEAINAAEATDILTAAVKVGRADPREFAASLGSILPVAASLGVTFEDAAGATAYLSNVFGDTNRTVTSLGGIFAKLLTPTDQGRKALEDMGTSVEELHAAIDQRGLLGALELLRAKGFGENQAALRDLFDDVEAFRGAVALLDDRSGQLASTLQATADSGGALGKAFESWGVTDAAQTAKAVQSMTASLIEFGAKLAPTAADLAAFAAAAFDAFSAMPEWAQIGLVALAVAIGPVLSGVSSMIGAFRTLQAAGIGLTASLGALAAVAAGVTILAVAWQRSAQAAAEHRQDVKDITAAYWEQGQALEFVTESTERYILEQSRFHDRNQIDDLNRINVSVETLNQMLSEGAMGWARFVAAAAAGGEIRDVTDEVRNMSDAARQQGEQAGDLIEINGRWYDGNVDLLRSFQELSGRLDETSASKLRAAIASGKLSDEQEREIQADLDGSESKTKHTETIAKWADVLTNAGIYVDDVTDAVDEQSRVLDYNTMVTQQNAAAQMSLFDTMFGARMTARDISSLFEDFSSAMDGTETSSVRAGRGIDVVKEKAEAVERATRDAERAAESYQDALDGQTDAADALVQAQRDLEEALKGPSADDRVSAEDDLTDARLSAEDANDAVTDAQAKYNDAVAEFGPTSDEARRALNDLNQAKQRAKAATREVTAAEEELNGILGWSAETAPEVVQARDAVAEAEKRVDEAAKNAAAKLREMDEAQRKAQETAAASPASFGAADGAMSNHRQRVLETRDAYLELAKGIDEMVSSIINAEIAEADKVAQIDQIIANIIANPKLTPDQRAELLRYAYGRKAGAMANPGWAGGGTVEFDSGGVIGGRSIGAPVLVKAHVGETIFPTHKVPLERMTASGGGGTVVINIDGARYSNERELAKAIVREFNGRGGFAISSSSIREPSGARR